LTPKALRQLVVLTVLEDVGNEVQAHQVLKLVREKSYYRKSISELSHVLSEEVESQIYIEHTRFGYRIKQKGRIRLRDLAELVQASPSLATTLTSQARHRLSELRMQLSFYPFTNGAPASKAKRVRNINGYSIYAILLHENALQLWYQIKNSRRNPKLPCVYVGMSRRNPVQRFDEHRFGKERLRSKYVDLDGLCLMPLLYSKVNKGFATKALALDTEKKFANVLRDAGFAVFAGHHDVKAVDQYNKAKRRYW
jgi:hypothetical protein